MSDAPTTMAAPKLTRKDFVSDQDVRWCPGCGDYSILAQVQKVMPELGLPRENFVFISGIGCSSRFPYYMNTYGFHSIHGRAPALATGLKISRPELSVWVVTGDGDGLSIGGNHLIHALRKNVGLKILLFNNRIYGLTKGQYSPTSELGKVTKSTPAGSVDYPFNPIAVAMGVDATFVARSIDVEAKHLQEILRRAYEHPGSAFIEILQNCNIFNDGAWESVSDKATKADAMLSLEHGKPSYSGRTGTRDRWEATAACRSSPWGTAPRRRTSWCTTRPMGRWRTCWPTWKNRPHRRLPLHGPSGLRRGHEQATRGRATKLGPGTSTHCSSGARPGWPADAAFPGAPPDGAEQAWPQLRFPSRPLTGITCPGGEAHERKRPGPGDTNSPGPGL
jgi:pyruvate/2-oxoacid:ferredoxin oxidoreductase beta subunit